MSRIGYHVGDRGEYRFTRRERKCHSDMRVKKEVANMDSKSVGAKITKLRKEKGYTQAELADILSVSNKTISRWETGDGYPEVSMLPQVAGCLGVSVDWLLSADEVEVNAQDGERLNENRENVGLRKFFLVMLICGGVYLLAEVIMDVLTQGSGSDAGNGAVALEAMRVIAFLVAIIFGVKKCLDYRKAGAEKSFAVAFAWTFSFVAIAAYVVCIRVAFLGMVNASGALEVANSANGLALATLGENVVKLAGLCLCAVAVRSAVQSKTSNLYCLAIIAVSLIYVGISVWECISDAPTVLFADGLYVIYTACIYLLTRRLEKPSILSCLLDRH